MCITDCGAGSEGMEAQRGASTSLAPLCAYEAPLPQRPQPTPPRSCAPEQLRERHAKYRGTVLSAHLTVARSSTSPGNFAMLRSRVSSACLRRASLCGRR